MLSRHHKGLQNARPFESFLTESYSGKVAGGRLMPHMCMHARQIMKPIR